MDKYFEFAVCEGANGGEFLALVPVGIAGPGMTMMMDGDLFDITGVIPAFLAKENAERFFEISGDTVRPDVIYQTVWERGKKDYEQH